MNANDGTSASNVSKNEEKEETKIQEQPTGKDEDKKLAGDAVHFPDTTLTELENLTTIPPVTNAEKSEIPITLHERFLRIKQIVKEAIANNRTFMIYGRSRVIRECMLKRGWCEKFFRRSSGVEQSLTPDSNPVTLLSGIGDLSDIQSERQLISKMLSSHTVDFLWNTGSEWPGWPSQDNKTTIFNRYCRAIFTSKIGLCLSVRQMHWHYEPGVANTLFPRCYNLCQSDQMHAFIEDFRFTACLGLLKWLIEKIDNEGENAARSPTGTIPLKALDFAIKRCTDFIGAQSHEDIDHDVERVWAYQWDQFMDWYYKIVQGQAIFVSNNIPLHKYFLAARQILKRIKKYWPQLEMDGITNVWILKPGNKSRGRGIVLMNKLENVLAKINPSNKTQDTRYVVQKYIERPFLVYSTKFDIRQWFIVTNAQPLTIWIYKESYLRFCSQKFSLTDFHESIHLCNNAVQCKYKNSVDRDPTLPVDNMWDVATFKQFLKKQGHDDVWDRLIYPGMKQGLIGSMLASQEAMDRRKNSFELYGADFMVMDDFSVWLIEINSHPDMSYSSSVTARLCRQVMEDTIKVVIDYRDDKNADTGEFELAYKQKMPIYQPYLGTALCLQGTRINPNEKRLSLSTLENKITVSTKSPMSVLNKKKSVTQTQIGPVIVDLIEELELQLDQEFFSFYKTESPKLRKALPSTATPSDPVTAEKSEMVTKGTSAIQIVKTSLSTSQIQQKKTADCARNVSGKCLTKKRAVTAHPPKIKKSLSTSKQAPLITKIMALHQKSTNPLPRLQEHDKILKQQIPNLSSKSESQNKIPKQISNFSMIKSEDPNKDFKQQLNNQRPKDEQNKNSKLSCSTSSKLVEKNKMSPQHLSNQLLKLKEQDVVMKQLSATNSFLKADGIDKGFKQNEDKMINSALQEAARKFKRSATGVKEPRSKSAFQSDNNYFTTFKRSNSVNKRQIFQRKSKGTKKLNEMFAIGININEEVVKV